MKTENTGVPLKLLILEDRPAEAEFLVAELRRSGFAPTWSRAIDENGFLKGLKTYPEIILIDDVLSKLNAPRVLHLMREYGVHVPVIVVTDPAGEEAAVECLELGASDYLLKDHLARLGSAVKRALELHRANQEVARSQRFLQSLFESAPEAVLVVGEDGQIQALNRRAEGMLGGEPGDLIGQPVERVIPEWSKRLGWLYQSGPETAPLTFAWSSTQQLVSRRWDGHRFIAEIKLSIVKDEDSRVGMAILRDITEQKQHEAILARYQLLFEYAGDIILIARLSDGCILEANRAAELAYGYNREELLALNITNLQDPETLPLVNSQMHQASSSGALVKAMHRRKDSSLFPVEISLLGADIEGERVTLCIVRDITWRIKSETALKESEARYRNLIEQAPIPIIVHRDGQVVYGNPAGVNLLGARSLEELMRSPSFDFIPYEHREQLNEQIQASLGSRMLFPSGEARLLRLDGIWIAVNVSSVPVHFNETPAILSMVQNITERRRAETALQVSELKFRNIIEQSSDGIVLIDQAGNIFEWNQAEERITGVSRKEVLGTPLWEVQYRFAHPDLKTSAWNAQLRNFIREGLENKTASWLNRVSIHEIHRPDGSVRMVETIVYPIQLEGEMNLGSVSRDITERVRAEEALQESEARYRRLFEDAALGIFQAEPDGRVIMVNPAFARMFGYASPEEALAETGIDIATKMYANPQRRREILNLMEEHPNQQTFENEYRRKDGSIFFGNLHLRLIRDAHGQIQYTEGLIEDITQHKQAEEEVHNLAKFPDENPNPVARVNQKGVVVYTNQACLPLLHHWKGRVGEVLVREYQQYIQAVLAGKQIHELEVNCGHQIYSLQAVPIPEEGYVNVYGRDITQLKLAEDHLHHQIEENLQRTRELEAVTEISTAMRRAGTQSEMITLLVEESTRVMEAQAGALAMLHGTSLVFQAAVGQLERLVDKIFVQDDSLFWRVIQNGNSRFIDSQEMVNSQAFHTLIQNDTAQLSASILAPLKSGSTTVGLLFLGYTSSPQLSTTQQRLVGTIAEMAGNALHRMSIANAMEKLVADRTRDLETIYQVTAASTGSTDLRQALQNALAPILDAVQAQTGAILLLNETKSQIRIFADQGLTPEIKTQIKQVDQPNSLESWVLEHKQPLVLPDLAADPRVEWSNKPGQPLPFTALPMRMGQRIVGILEVTRIGDPQFNLAEVTLLSFVADHLGLVVENAHLLHQAEHSAVLEERSRLSRELHDSVTQSLFSATLFADGGRRLAEQGDQEKVREYLIQLGKVTQQALKEMRLMVFELRSPALRSEGLVRAIQHRLNAVEIRSGIQASIEANRLPKLPERVEEALYRIALEALNNSLKHSAAKTVTVTLRKKGQQIFLSVSDDGQGFIPEKARQNGGLGITSMQERAMRLKGMLQVRSEPGGGAEITAILPINRHEF